jgi:hypothetical protein
MKSLTDVGVDHRRVDHQHVRDVIQGRDRCEVGLDVERQALVERGIDAMGRCRAEQEGVAVGRRRATSSEATLPPAPGL